MYYFCFYYAFSYRAQIEPVWNSSFDDSDGVSNQQVKIAKLFEIFTAIFDLKLHEIIIISDKFVKYK